jgi:tetratricopeptide (TPR) repeat protein
VLALIWTLVRSASVATVTAVFFAVHPIHTEAVTSIVGRAELLAALFILAALLAFERAIRSGGSKSTKWHALAAGCFALGLLSKESALSALGLFPIVYGWTSGKLEARRLALACAPYTVLGASYLALRFAVVGAIGMPDAPSELDNPLAHVAAGPRIGTALVVLWEYLSQLTFPSQLSADYSFNEIPIVTSFLEPRLLLAAAGLATCTIGIVTASRRSPEVALAAVLFLVPLSLTANILFPIGTIKAERLLYLPSAGWCLLLAWTLCVLLRDHRTARVLLTLVLVSAGAARTYARNRDWRDNIALFEAAVQASPDSAKAHYNLATLYNDAGRLNEATVHFRRALEIYPQCAGAAFGIGEIYAKKGIDAGAASWYERALQLDWNRAKFHVKLGMLRYRIGENDAAIAAFLTGLRIKPNHRTLHTNLAIARLAAGDVWEAWDSIDRATAAAAGNTNALAFANETRRIIDRVVRR